jgi:hypothetical protein
MVGRVHHGDGKLLMTLVLEAINDWIELLLRERRKVKALQKTRVNNTSERLKNSTGFLRVPCDK